jgi:hypothetical protein
MLMLVTLCLNAQTPINLPAADTFSALAGTLADSPITTQAQFKNVEAELKYMGFTQVNSVMWRYVNAGDVVLLQAYPDKGHFFVDLSPGSPQRQMGDAALAALIAKASAAFFNEGDSIELLVSEKHSVKEGYSGSDSIYLHFKLSGGTWWKTSRVIEWSK